MQTYYPSLRFIQPRGHSAYISKTVIRDRAGITEDVGRRWQREELMNFNVAVMSEA